MFQRVRDEVNKAMDRKDGQRPPGDLPRLMEEVNEAISR